MNIAEKILKLRKEKSLSQEAFAEKLGVSRQSVSKWESSGALPDIDKIIAMSELFGVSTDYLLKDDTADLLPSQADEEADALPEAEETEYIPQPEVKKPTQKNFRKIIAIILVILITAAAVGIPSYYGGIKELWWEINGGRISYPYVLVHGLGGWGDGDGINNVAQYWGGGGFNLKEALEDEGYTVHTPSVGPVSSTWDRTCELYAMLTGTRVDYGEAHSKAHGHERYGRTYTEPLVAGWGEKINGGQLVKINLVGHSFGGATVRLLASLLEYGSEEEMQISGNGVSPLFTGGKGDHIHSVTALCAPHNGSSLTEILNSLGNTLGIGNTTDLLMTLCFGISGSSVPIDGVYDLKLDHFGIKNDDTEKALSSLTQLGTDHAAYDLSPDGAAELNKKIRTVDGIYYFSYAYSTTNKGAILGNHIPDKGTLAILSPFALAMGSYTGTTEGGIAIDGSWKENDGLVNVISARYPFGEMYAEMPEDAEDIKAGIWNVAATREGDHGNVIGLDAKENSTVKFYKDLFDTVDSLR